MSDNIVHKITINSVMHDKARKIVKLSVIDHDADKPITLIMPAEDFPKSLGITAAVNDSQMIDLINAVSGKKVLWKSYIEANLDAKKIRKSEVNEVLAHMDKYPFYEALDDATEGGNIKYPGAD